MTNYWYYIDGGGSIDCADSKKKARLECIRTIKKCPWMRYNIICTNSYQMEDTCIERILEDRGKWVATVKKQGGRKGYADEYEILKDGSLGKRFGSQDW